MCDETITPQVPGVDKLPANAKVFIEGKNRPLFANEDAAEISRRKAEAVQDGFADVAMTNLNGEVTYIAPQRIVSIVEAKPRGERVEVSGGEFWGKRFTVRGLTDTDVTELRGPLGIDPARHAERQGEPTGALDGRSISEYAIAIGEDLGEAEIAIVHLVTGDVAWANPAEPERSLRRIVKAVRLLGESLAITDAEAAQA